MFFIGDSHVRYWLYYILSSMNKLPTFYPVKIETAFDVKNFSFRWGTFIEVMINEF